MQNINETSNISSCIKYFSEKMRDELKKEKKMSKMLDDLYGEEPEITDYAKRLIDNREANIAMREQYGFCLTDAARRLLSKK